MGLVNGQKVFKKASPDGNVTLYVDKRTFVDHVHYSETIESVITVDRNAVSGKKLFAAVVATFRFGREEDEILGMTFCRELYVTHDQIWPPPSKQPSPATPSKQRSPITPPTLQSPVTPPKQQPSVTPSNQQTSITTSNLQSTVTTSDQQAPATASKQPLPVTPSKQQTPVTPSKQPLPVTSSTEQAPVSKRKQSLPVTPSKQQTPVTPSKQQLPVTPSKQQLSVTPSKQPSPRRPSKQSLPLSPSKQSSPGTPSKRSLPVTPIQELDMPIEYHSHRKMSLDIKQVKQTAKTENLLKPVPCTSKEGSPTKTLLRSSGEEESICFTFRLPLGTPPSVVMQRGPKESGDSCGVRYFLRCYVANSECDKPQTASSVDLAVRKVHLAPGPVPFGHLPFAKITKEFPLSHGQLCLEANLDKRVYDHGEDITLSVQIRNLSGKTVKHVKATVVQVADICMFSTGRWKIHIATQDDQPSPSVHPGSSYSHEFTFCPSLEENRAKYGIFTQSQLTSDEDCLASSTLIKKADKEEFFGIIISYYVKVKLCTNYSLNPLPSEVSCILPFMMMHSASNGQTQETEIAPSYDWDQLSDCNTDTGHKHHHKKVHCEDAFFQKLAKLRVRLPLIG